MSSKTKIVVLRMKELIYTGICVAFGLLFVIILLMVFLPKGKDETSKDTSANAAYVPGVHSTQLILGNHTIELEVVADDTGNITDIRFAALDESVTTLYPLLEPSLSSISTQFMETGTLENISYDDSSRYTSLILLEALSKTLEKASIQEN
ncbi:MAG: hypothetical protein IJ335_07945 [Lachnospiraceae bacterium]|nr:hypothetical protein [Lachnospiraceae bacterium]